MFYISFFKINLFYSNSNAHFFLTWYKKGVLLKGIYNTFNVYVTILNHPNAQRNNIIEFSERITYVKSPSMACRFAYLKKKSAFQ